MQRKILISALSILCCYGVYSQASDEKASIAAPNQALLDKTVSYPTGYNQTGSNPTGSNQTESKQIDSNQTGSKQTGSTVIDSNQTNSNETASKQADSNQNASSQTGSKHVDPNQTGSNFNSSTLKPIDVTTNKSTPADNSVPTTDTTTTNTTLTPSSSTNDSTPNSTLITTPSTAPKPNTAVPNAPTREPDNKNRFDGPSFFGGIILCLGMVAIGFLGLRYYKARTERNYHTL